MAEEADNKADKGLSREDWRLVMPMHLEDTREEAIREVDEANQRYNKDYFEDTLGRPADPTVKADVASQVERGGAIVGTPDDAIAAIERMQELSGGFGALLALAHEWTSWEKTKHSYELFARYVAPRFQGQIDRIEGSQQFVASNRTTIFGPNAAAIGKAFIDGGVALREPMLKRMQRGNT